MEVFGMIICDRAYGYESDVLDFVTTSKRTEVVFLHTNGWQCEEEGVPAWQTVIDSALCSLR